MNISILGSNTLFGADFADVYLEWEAQTSDRLRVKIYPANTTRYEVPIKIEAQDPAPEDTRYQFMWFPEPTFSFRVIRKSNMKTIFDSSLGPLIISDQFLQVAGTLSSENIYGFGEQEQASFKHDGHWKTWGMFARDHAPEGDANLYGAHPR